MKLRPLTLQICVFFCFCIIYLYTSLAEAASVIDIHRSVCRKDTLVKATDRNKKLTATASNIILQLHEKSLSRCTIKCVKNERCVSTNYKKNFANEEEKNCELLDVNKTSASVTLSDENGWIHYEPVIQTGPRCRLVTCNAGFQCNETCQKLAGYECVDVNECLSNPCQNGGTCSNQVNQYTCTCVAGYIETNCQTNFDECGSNPCQNGGTCIDGVNKYTCNCAAGYVGTHCQTNVDECASQPCQGFATCVDGVNKYTCQDTCTSSPCLNGATCIPKATSYNCLCAPGYIGQRCGSSTSAKYTSCKQMHVATGWTANGVFTLWNKALTQRYNAYCHMSYGGWTLIARFSNKDTKNWMQTSGHYWYDQLATGDTTNPYTNADMINEAFYEAPGGSIKISKTDNPLTWIMYTVSSCLGGATFRSKIISYGNFRNNAPWSIDACKGSCQVQAYSSGVSGVSGFSQYSCSSTIQANNYIGFWCHYSTGDGDVIMIGGGGSSCSRADHGIGVTEADSPKFGSPTYSLDFGNDGQGTAVTSYGLNLWIR